MKITRTFTFNKDIPDIIEDIIRDYPNMRSKSALLEHLIRTERDKIAKTRFRNKNKV